MKKILLIIALTIASNAGTGFLNEEDKQKHFAVSVGIAFAGANIAHYYGHSDKNAWLIGWASATIVGLAKESYDMRSEGSGFDSGDIVANGFGAIAGSSVSMLIFKW